MKSKLLPLVSLTIGVGLVIFTLTASTPAAGAPPALVTTGKETPRPDCLYRSGWNVCDWGTKATIKSTYLGLEEFLGDPVGTFDAKCQIFVGGSLCVSEGNPEGWTVEVANLGAKQMTAEGYRIQPGSPADPLARDYLLSLTETGVDIVRVFGRLISPPLCDRQAGTCRQYTDKQLLEWPVGATSGISEVRRAPLGLWQLHPPPPEPVPQPAPPYTSPAFIGGLLLGGVGLVALVLSRGGSRRQQAGGI